MRFIVLLLFISLAGCAASERSLELISGAAPAYPPAARAAGQEGWVQVRYNIDDAGRVQSPIVIAAQPAGVFEEAALATVSAWRFRPAAPGAEPRVIQNVESR
ncbi:MAG: energy transducer TonB, partial [Pseudomonadales bacterium]